MRDVLYHIMENYVHEKRQTFGKNELAMFIRHKPKDVLADFGISPQQYKFTGSAGQGNWAIVPWIAIFDRDISTTATSGYYIVYLFKEDMSGVYVSLNQGWTYFAKTYGNRKGLEEISAKSLTWRQILTYDTISFPEEELDLKSPVHYAGNTKIMTRGYELGNICGKYYPKDALPTNLELKEDLLALLEILNELKKLYRSHQILSNKSEDIVGNENELEEYPENILITLKEKEAPKRKSAKKSRTFGTKIDYESRNRKNKKLGTKGEQYVLLYEKEQLEQSGRFDLAQKIQHISEEKGDGLGYDILSYHLDGKEKYIEVKTTKQNQQDCFYLTARENEIGSNNKDNYYIYRLYNFNPRKATADLVKYLYADIVDAFDLEPLQFMVVAKEKVINSTFD